MNENRYVAAWNELKEMAENQVTIDDVVLLHIIKGLEAKYGIPSKEAKDGTPTSDSPHPTSS